MPGTHPGVATCGAGMPKSLTQFLQISGQVSIRQIREARRAQEFFGGSLLYNLVRLKILPEEKSKELLSEWMEFPYAPLVDLITIPRRVLDFVDRDVAARRRVLPFQTEEDHLFVATARLGNDPFYRDLGNRCGLPVIPHAILEEHLEPLLEKHYGIKAARRETIRLAKADSALVHAGSPHDAMNARSPEPGMAASEVGLDGLPLDSDVTPSQILPARSNNPTSLMDKVETIDDSASPVASPEKPGVLPAGHEPVRPAAGLASPLTRLARAGDRAAIGEAAVEHALALGIPRVALLGRRRDSLVGWHAGGSGVPVERFARLAIPFYVPSIFAGFKITGNPYTGVIPDQPANRELLAALGKGVPPKFVAAVPIHMGERMVAAIYGDGGPAATTPVDQELLVQLAAKIAAALEILILRRKILA